MSWDRIRGHGAALETLQTAYSQGRFGQAYLFVGPEGTGKRAFAQELARCLLCEHPPSPLRACGGCPGCAQVMAGTHPDLLWARTPEGKHEFPIDTMREFCALLARKPTRGGRKVGIVEDADDFNQESANAFLKTLEEPPPGTLLLLLATSIDRQLPTILSRCQVIRFRALSPSDLSAVLVEKEVDDAARRDRLVRLAGGSVSRALALNDEAIWKLREELIAGITSARPDYHRLGTSWSQYVEEAAKDTVAKRTRASALIGFLLDMLRQSLRIGLGANTSLMETSEEARLRAFADRLGPDRLLTLIDRCVEADYRVERRVELNLICDWVMSQFQQASSPMQPSAASRK